MLRQKSRSSRGGYLAGWRQPVLGRGHITLLFGHLESKCIKAISGDHCLEYPHVISGYSCKAAAMVVIIVPGALFHALFLSSCLQIIKLAMLAPGFLS